VASRPDHAAGPGWVSISDAVTAGVKCDWPGLTAGVTVDRTNGDLYMILCGQGVWKSTDQGTTFHRVDGSNVGGRCETGYGLSMDPSGGRLCCFMLDGTSAITLDSGRTWRKLAQQGRGWDYAAVDWSSRNPQTIYAMQHESGGKCWLSTDGGASWRFLHEDPSIVNGSAFGLGVVDAHTLVRWRGESGIERSADLGATWVKVSDLAPASHVMVVFKGVCYWLGKSGLIVSRDHGRTWRVQGSPIGAAWGPYFGRSSNQVVAASAEGLYESEDAGRSWRLMTGLPQELQEKYLPGWFLNVAFDPAHDVFYVSRMGKPTYRLQL
jgi:hypothetical protein